jgi:ribosomal protein L4
VVTEVNETLGLASRNVPGVALVEASDLTPYDVVTAHRLLIAKDALAHFEGGSNAA